MSTIPGSSSFSSRHGLALLALTGTLATPLAQAVDLPEADGGLQEIVVSAQKRETSLQSTPISISVLGSDDLANRHAQSLADLGDGSIPSLRVAPFFARSSALTIGMRGIGAMGDANQPSRDQGVGVYVDGVYLGRAQGLGTALYDVARIEVLKGPQGTLFGRNTEGGAISIVTKKPTGKFDLNTTMGVGDYGSYKDEIHLNLPSYHDVSVKVDGLLSKRDGTVRNPLDGQPNFNSYDKRGLRTEAVWKLSEDFSADYAFDSAYDATTPYYVQLVGPGSLARAPLIKLQADRATSANVGAPLQPSVGTTHGHLLTLDWTLSPDLEIKSLSSYRTLKQSQLDNGASNLSVYAPNGNFSRYSLAHFDQSQYSEELQLIGKVSQVSFVGGGFYYHEDVQDDAQTPNTLKWNADGTAYTVISLPPLSTISKDRASTATTDSMGLFGQATWTPLAFNEIAHLTVGGRYTRDKKQGSLNLVNGAAPTVCAAVNVCVTGAQKLDKSWDRVDPMVNLAVDVTADVHVYGKWSTGYKAGGANSRSLTYRPFNPESVSSFELGAKTEFLDNRARFNVAAYTATYQDVQIDFNAVIPGNNRGTLETTNTAGSGRTKGVEADLTLAPVNGLLVTLGYAYTNITLPSAPNPFVSGNPLVKVYPLYTPGSAGSAALDYELPVAGATLKAHVDGNFANGYRTSATDPTYADASFVVNGRLALADIRLADAGATLQVSLWSRNLLDESHAFLKNFNSSLGTYGIFNEPRTVGIEANVKF